MNDSLADILGIMVDGGTVVYAGYKTGRWVWEHRERLTRRGQHLRVTITDRSHLSDSHTQVVIGGGIPSLSSTGGGTLLPGTAMASPRISSSALGTLSVLRPQEKLPA